MEKHNARALAEAGMEIKTILNQSITPRHPHIPQIAGVAYVMFRALGAQTYTSLMPPYFGLLGYFSAISGPAPVPL